MPQRLRTLAVLPEIHIQFPAPTWQLTTLTPDPEDLTPSHRQTDMHAKHQSINTHKIKINYF